ncbi:uncharacterized protein LOC132639407 [Lycium barbarum]|uniref:uncharacterized protein LOC132639407 n=1 Tax=Lycium barbarum TaxID=112863 RepID=UPI00293E41B3|nr:uncharacterized protein LOC132639407 [Lycium barbarum]
MALDMNIHELLVIGDSDLLINQVKGNWVTKNDKILPYVNLAQRLCGRFNSIDFRHMLRAQNEFADAVATIASMIQHPESAHIDSLEITLREDQTHCAYVEAELDGQPWYVDIRTYLEKGEYPLESSTNQKKTIRRLANGFFLSKEVLYKRTPDLRLLKCVDAEEATKLLKEIHGDLIKAPPTELHAMSSPWPFLAWGMDVIGPTEPSTSNGHRFILVSIDYFTKWVEVTSHKSVTKKVVVDFVKNNLICRFGVPESIITDNGANLNSHLMKDISEQFKITHRKSTAYRPKMNGVVEAAKKNIKRILRKMVDNYKNWHKQLPYALLGYRTTTRATPYLLVYGTEAVIPAEVEIPSLKIIQEAELKDEELVKNRYEQLAMIKEKRMVAHNCVPETSLEIPSPRRSREHQEEALSRKTMTLIGLLGNSQFLCGCRFFLYRTADTPPTSLLTAKAKGKNPNGGERSKGSQQKRVIKTHLTKRVTQRMNNKGVSDQKGHNG